jgi:hypothetical protein
MPHTKGDKEPMSYLSSLLRYGILSLMTIIVLGLSGCEKGPKLVPVTGTVTLDGKPVETAGLLFLPVDSSGTPGNGETDAQGRFQLKTRSQVGAQVGKYYVGIVKSVYSNSPKPKWLTPQKYSDAKTSGLTAEVTADGKNDFEFKMTSN